MKSTFDAEAFAKGIQLFNERRFFDAHEVLEEVWRAAAADEKRFFQGLIQVAVALHHYSTGNVTGASSVIKRAIRNLSGYPDHHRGVDLGNLLTTMHQCADALGSKSPLPCVPQIGLREC